MCLRSQHGNKSACTRRRSNVVKGTRNSSRPSELHGTYTYSNIIGELCFIGQHIECRFPVVIVVCLYSCCSRAAVKKKTFYDSDQKSQPTAQQKQTFQARFIFVHYDFYLLLQQKRGGRLAPRAGVSLRRNLMTKGAARQVPVHRV